MNTTIKEKDTDFLKDVKIQQEVAQVPVDEMPLNTYADYLKYNLRAVKENQKLKLCRYTVKPCPEELHPKQRVVFNRRDQPNNPLPAYLSNHLIHFNQMLQPGKTYDLPHCVIDYLSAKGTAEWGWIENPDGSKETKKITMEPRFSIRTLWDRS